MLVTAASPRAGAAGMHMPTAGSVAIPLTAPAASSPRRPAERPSAVSLVVTALSIIAVLALLYNASTELRPAGRDAARKLARHGGGDVAARQAERTLADNSIAAAGAVGGGHGKVAFDTRRYLVPGTWNNVNNQRLSLLRGLATAQELNLTLVLPHWHLNYYDYPPYGTPVLKPFDYFYSSEHLAAYGREHGFDVVTQLPPDLMPACLSQLQHSWATEWSVRPRPDGTIETFGPSAEGNCPSVGNLTAAMLTWADAYGVVCVTAKCSFYMQKPGPTDIKLNAYRPALKLSPVFEREVDMILGEVAVRYNTTRYVAVHARVEGDWKAECPAAEQAWAVGNTGYTCYIDEAGIAAFMKPRVPAGSLVFIASGAPLESFKVLCSLYRCWNRQLVRPVAGPGVLQKSTSHAFTDLQLAMHGAAFFGNFYSTFSNEVQRHLYPLVGDDATWYNPRLQEAA